MCRTNSTQAKLLVINNFVIYYCNCKYSATIKDIIYLFRRWHDRSSNGRVKKTIEEVRDGMRRVDPLDTSDVLAPDAFNAAGEELGDGNIL